MDDLDQQLLHAYRTNDVDAIERLEAQIEQRDKGRREFEQRLTDATSEREAHEIVYAQQLAEERAREEAEPPAWTDELRAAVQSASTPEEVISAMQEAGHPIRTVQ